ncbi:hypothetical protein N9M52_00430 [bacterium]|nr:hypothetical protein [bacterium]MDA8752452.1 hypothetical protein [bacterium]
MAIFIGLNTEKGMIDVDNPREALRNLGLRKEDFDVISGLVDKGVTLSDFNAISGLEVDQKSVLKGLGEAAEYTSRITDAMDDIRVPMNFNMVINNRVAAGAIKFNYANFSTVEGLGAAQRWQIKGADISTSRTSSWSPVGPAGNEDSEIQYGGSIQLNGDVLGMSSLRTLDAPIEKKFRAEVATHYVNIKSRDNSGTMTTNKFLAMKGIPLVWDGFFMTANFKASVGTGRTDNALGYSSTVPITWRITDADGLKTYISGDGTTQFPGSIGTGPNINSPTSYVVATNEDKQRKIEFFYDPSYVKMLGMPFCGLSQWTNVALPSLEVLDLELNDLNVIPEFRDDAEYSKSHVTGGRGLAPNLKNLILTGNNLSRAQTFLDGLDGYDTANAKIAGQATKQLNRLPLTLQDLRINGCFTDNSQIDIRDYKALRTLYFGSGYQRDTRRYHLHVGCAPKTYDPEITTQTQTIANLFTFTNQIDTSYDTSFGDRLYGSSAGVNATALVRVQFHTSSNGATYDPTASGNANTLVDDKIILLKKQYAAGSTTHIHSLRNQADTADENIDNSAATGLVRFFAVEDGTSGTTLGDTRYDDSGGISLYNVTHQPKYTQMPGGVYNSANLTDFRIQQDAIDGNQNSYGFDKTNTTSWEKSSTRKAIPKPRSEFIVRYYSDGYSQNHNVIDMRDKTSLRTYWHRASVVDSNYRSTEKSIDSKIDGCTNLEYFNMYYTRNVEGDWSSNGMFQGKSKLYLIDIRWNSNVRFRFKDDAFLGSNALKHFRVANTTSNRFNNDILGTSGEANRQGQMFRNKTNLHDIYCYWNWTSSGSLVNPSNDEFSLNLTDNLNLRTIYIRGNDLRGPLPNWSFLNQLRRLDIRNNKWKKTVLYAHPLQTYTIQNKDGGMTKAMWESIGWVASAADPLTGINHGTNPANGDSFVADYLLLSDNSLVNGKKYWIRELGAGSNWSSIGAGASPYVGKVFTYNGTTPAGSGYCWPYYNSNVLSRGLTGVLPELTCEKLTWFLASVNSFTGQVPKWNLPRLYQLWLFNNELSGSIPDFSDCPRLWQCRLSNNKFESYLEGSLALNTNLTDLDMSNNRLGSQYGPQLIYDLYENYILRPRGGVTVNVLGQTPLVGDGLNENDAVDDGTDGPESTANKLATLRNAGWTILLDQ